MRSVLPIIAAILTVIGLTSAANAGSAVMEIACGSIPLIDDTKKCSDERTAGSELEIIVNPTTQKVQISVIKNKIVGNISVTPPPFLKNVRWSM